MRNAWTIASREYRQYFQSSIAYVVAFLILFVSGIWLVAYIYFGSTSAYTGGYYAPPPPTTSDVVINPTAVVLLFAAPALTMRLLADEHRAGTLELLLTAPLKDWELVFGKWLGAMLYLLTVYAFSLIIPVVLNSFVSPGIDWGVTLSGYLGLILLTAAFLAIGTAFSSFFKNQFAAFFGTFFMILFMWWIISIPASLITNAADFLNYLNVRTHLGNMMNGVIGLNDLVYFLTWTVLGLFLGSVATEIRRWQ